MSNGFYLTLVLIVGFVSIAVGFRQGITRQLASLLGFSFGAVAARVLARPLSDSFEWASRWAPHPMFADFAVNLVSAVIIFAAVYLVFLLFSRILNGAMAVFEIGMFNRILGAFFSLVKYMLWLSIFLNLSLCFSTESGLMRYETANDGNLVAGVMEITPLFLGCYGADDFAHFHQLKEAKGISLNYNARKCVIDIETPKYALINTEETYQLRLC